MTHAKMSKWVKIALAAAGMISISACSTMDELSSVGSAPKMSKIENVQAPATEKSLTYNRPNLAPKAHARGTSLWREGASTFHQDQRARNIGDILRVQVAINDSATLGNQTSRTRNGSEQIGVPNLFGLEAAAPYLLGNSKNTSGPLAAARNAFDASSLVSGTSSGSYAGTGSVNRSESINILVSAMVTDVLPNGNLVIEARQETVVNFERRDLVLTGIIRPQDVSSDNTIQHSQIAQARLFYGGKGQLTNAQQPRKGQQIFDILFPF